MAADFIIKQHDTRPFVYGTLSDANGAIDLSTASSVELFFEQNGTTWNGSATISDQQASPGQFVYEWGPNDTATVGVIKVEVRVTFQDLTRMTVPSQGYLAFLVTNDIEVVVA